MTVWLGLLHNRLGLEIFEAVAARLLKAMQPGPAAGQPGHQQDSGAPQVKVAKGGLTVRLGVVPAGHPT